MFIKIMLFCYFHCDCDGSQRIIRVNNQIEVAPEFCGVVF